MIKVLINEDIIKINEADLEKLKNISENFKLYKLINNKIKLKNISIEINKPKFDYILLDKDYDIYLIDKFVGKCEVVSDEEYVIDGEILNKLDGSIIDRKEDLNLYIKYIKCGSYLIQYYRLGMFDEVSVISKNEIEDVLEDCY